MKDNRFELLLESIRKQTGLDFLERNRKVEYIEARSVFFYIIRKELDINDEAISFILSEMGYKFDRTTIRHSIVNFDVYYNSSNYCKELYEKNSFVYIKENNLIDNEFIIEDEEKNTFIHKKLDMVSVYEGGGFYKVYVPAFSLYIKRNADLVGLIKLINKLDKENE